MVSVVRDNGADAAHVRSMAHAPEGFAGMEILQHAHVIVPQRQLGLRCDQIIAVVRRSAAGEQVGRQR